MIQIIEDEIESIKDRLQDIELALNQLAQAFADHCEESKIRGHDLPEAVKAAEHYK